MLQVLGVFTKKLSDKILQGVIQFPLMYRGGCPGISCSTKADIIKELCPLMPANRRLFWEGMESNKHSNVYDE